MSFEPEDIKYINIYNDEKVIFEWGVNKFGFGQTVFLYEDGKLKCDNEYLDKDTIKKLICEFIDRAKFTDI